MGPSKYIASKFVGIHADMKLLCAPFNGGPSLLPNVGTSLAREHASETLPDSGIWWLYLVLRLQWLPAELLG